MISPAKNDVPVTSATTNSHQLTMVSPPATVRPFEPRPGEGPGTWVDYASHPAYAPLAQKVSLRKRAAALGQFTKYFGFVAAKRLISYELIPLHVRRPRDAASALKFAQAALGGATRNVLARRRRAGAPVANGVDARLREDGVCVAALSPQDYRRIVETAQPLFDELRQKRGERDGGRRFEESRTNASPLAHKELFEVVQAIMQESGILDAVSGYFGRKCSLIDINPQINDESDDFWRRIFPDQGAADRPLSYCHRDCSGDIKAILYMTDVSEENGPFTFAVGSHRLHNPLLIDRIEETNDQSGASGTDPASRERFAALPAWLQRKCAFGNDVLPSTEIVERVRASEWTITAPQGHVVVFDTKGFHRGGMVQKGERRVLTCVLG